MSTTKLTLNLFGEIIKIEPPSTLFELKQKISENFDLKKSTYELKLYYKKESKNIYIETEEDYKKFLETKFIKFKLKQKKMFIYIKKIQLLQEKKNLMMKKN